MAADDDDGGAVELLLPRGVVQVLRRALLLGEEEEEETVVVPIVQSCVPAPSAQHQVWIVHLHDAAVAVFFSSRQSSDDDLSPSLWRDCLVRGHNRVVVRVWRGRCRWWNLHHPHPHDDDDDDDGHAAESSSTTSAAAGETTEENEEEENDDDNIARHELWGYRTAQLAFESSSSTDDRCDGDGDDSCAASSTSMIRIPVILYDGRRATTTTKRTGGGGAGDDDDFAIFEYVGVESTLFGPNNNNNNHPYHNDDDSSLLLFYSMDTFWTDGMVKIRNEYGYADEPHPRWGRVPVHLALSYAMQILHEIILPLHAYCRSRRCSSSIGTTTMVGPPPASSWVVVPQHHYYTFQDLVARHRRLLDTVLVPTFLGPKEEEAAAPTTANGDTIGTTTRPWAAAVVRRLQAAIMAETMIEPSLMAPVLVHMDLQPQNIIFGRRRRRRQCQQGRKDNPPGRQQDDDDDDENRRVVVSVLDWEEAAWADPRFELLLLGRKVCANRSQALAVWEMYQTATGLALGSLDVWLRLETVHSLITLLLQAATGKGRGGGVETAPPDDDLWGKIQREMARLDAYDDDDA